MSVKTVKQNFFLKKKGKREQERQTDKKKWPTYCLWLTSDWHLETRTKHAGKVNILWSSKWLFRSATDDRLKLIYDLFWTWRHKKKYESNYRDILRPAGQVNQLNTQLLSQLGFYCHKDLQQSIFNHFGCFNSSFDPSDF